MISSRSACVHAWEGLRGAIAWKAPPRLLTYSTLYFEARDVLAFLGRKVHGNFQGDVVTDQVDFSQMPKRLPGRRVKHRMKRNWMKLYNDETLQ